jgi:hypothetical protein
MPHDPQDATSDKKLHRTIAVDLFNAVWGLMDKADRTPEEDDAMLHAAHASRHHWSIAGSAVNLARGEWQVSRVYAVLGRAEPAGYHARRCMDICSANGLGDFDLAYAYEAIARAASIAGDHDACVRNIDLARHAADDIARDDDRKLLLADLETITL